jgi:prepilin-type processing-associated H-X9-DG protein
MARRLVLLLANLTLLPAYDDFIGNSRLAMFQSPAIDYHLTTLICPAASNVDERSGSQGRGVTDYSPPNQITRPNAAVKKMPPSDSTFVGAMGHTVKRPIPHITDGTSNTILLAEDAGRCQHWVMGVFKSNTGTTGAWGNPANELVLSGYNVATNATPGACAVNCTNANEMYSFHMAGANTGFCDGSVRFLHAETDINIVMALVTRACGEQVPSELQ